jgi:pyruvate/2-oxoglutarate dehydrogenase complex dihydrolipoamide dehydrogenase (E3) component
MESYDIVIIGAGQAGMPLALALAVRNKRTALIERKYLGGSCINFGCTPTKAAITSARLAHLARRSSEFGVHIPSFEVDFGAVIRRARSIAESTRSGLESTFAPKENPKLIRGHARLAGREGDRFRVVIGDQTITAAQVVIDTGTRSFIPPIEGINDLEVIHAGNWLDYLDLPKKLIIIGGGVIALEMAQFYRRMGSEVVVIESMSQIAGTEDADVATALQEILEREGIEFHLETRIERVARRGGAVVVALGGGQEIVGTNLFVATGRKPNTDDIGLETVGVEASKGIIKVNERLATSVPGIWAAGDVRGGPMFTHTAWDDHRILLSQLAGDGSRTTDRVVPYAIFTDPEVGRVGMNEREARKSGKNVSVKLYEIRRNSKARELGEVDGFIKVLIDRDSEQILGATVFCAEAAELVHIYIDAMNARSPYTVIRDAVYIHPTLAEAIQSAVTIP